MSAAGDSAARRAVRREMGISHADFRRIFPRLLDDAAASVDGTGAHASWPDGRLLTVRLSPERERRIALLRLPTTDLEFEFRGFSPAACEAFLGRFDRAFQKGGG
ncbi:MAG: hypothetical protein RLW62_22385 [Gammaproteobacteria bacterium]